MTFSESQWKSVTEKMAGTIRLGEDELLKLRQNRVAKLVAAIPFVAGCDNCERTSLAHLGIYMMAKNESCKAAFGHLPEDDSDVMSRIRLLDGYSGGDEAVIEKGMKLLALIQLEDHRQDLEDDKAAGKYNPLASGAWDYDALRKNLVTDIESIESPELDVIMSIDSVRGYWNGD